MTIFRSRLGTFNSTDPQLTAIDLNDVVGIQEGVEYNYTLVAINNIGPSDRSNHVLYEIALCKLTVSTF